MTNDFGPRRVALLPLYLELYDQAVPHLLPRQEQFLERVAETLHGWGIGVTKLPVCRTRAQVAAAVSAAERLGMDGLITLHLAYSPSLEAAEPLLTTPLPLLLLDTTPASRLPEMTGDAVLENHGIHGVQDLTCVLRREGRRFLLAVGALDSPPLRRATDRFSRAAHSLRVLRQIRVAQVGTPFPGMGDFTASKALLAHAVGPDVTSIGIARVAEMSLEVSAEMIAAESAADREAFDCSGCDAECWERANRVGLGLRRALREAEVHAFTFNFADFDSRIGTPTVPFLEASKAMARGMGYAGEGDAVTATLVAALNCCYGPTTFTEMFCPDWEGGRIFMSHMGELNPVLAKRQPRLVEKRYGFGAVENPAVLVFPLRPGPAALVNLVPCREEQMALIAADVEVLDTEPEPGIPDSPHFWIAPPNGDTADFLRRYSEAGGTHHLALTPGAQAADFANLAAMKGWRFTAIT
jgi:L-arabinose isomerase